VNFAVLETIARVTGIRVSSGMNFIVPPFFPS
jgi:hypothetical protein